ncbi:MAG: hydroxyacylglutathione hydrolase [Methylobacillus sp.]|jgi:hydroxyacylglutathione hydrolase|nr:hydroxyacylglutathione hydrolase [Methylobacillus sp.]
MSTPLAIVPIPAFRDNYIWLMRRGNHAAIVDPGDAAPVFAYLAAEKLALKAVLVTHHHGDHIGGIAELLDTFPDLPVYAPRKENYAFPHTPVGEGDTVNLEPLQLQFKVMETPGHTLGHVVYYGANSLFCGDTLFSCGCGRLFEGTYEQLHDSLSRLAHLPPETRVYCTHEYTQYNIRFARHLDPKNEALAEYEKEAKHLRDTHQPTLPSTMARELACNPFLRCDDPVIQTAALANGIDALAAFCAIRQMRNEF